MEWRGWRRDMRRVGKEEGESRRGPLLGPYDAARCPEGIWGHPELSGGQGG